MSGRVQIAGHANANIEIKDDVWGATGQGPAIEVGGALSGEIRLYASLCYDRNLPPALADVRLGAMAAGSAIAVVWPGYDFAHQFDGWEPGAVIRVGDTDYFGNTPAARIYEISCFKGELNGDRVVDFNDVNAFVMALNPAEYEAAYPGLGGSRLYHADCNCDTYADFNDINPFAMRVYDPNAWYAAYPNCEMCGIEGNGLRGPAPVVPRIAARDLAARLASAVLPQNYTSLCAAAAYVAANDPNAEVREYWRAVHAALAP
ncbi:MAG: hypothetical protein AB1716_09510 [Planctomycetota bacterium]